MNRNLRHLKQRTTYTSRDQPLFRQKQFGKELPKHKDYTVRAKKYHEARDELDKKILDHSLENPAAFFHKMVSEQIVAENKKTGDKTLKRKDPSKPDKIKAKKRSEINEKKRLQSGLTSNLQAMKNTNKRKVNQMTLFNVNSGLNKHTIFVDDIDESLSDQSNIEQIANILKTSADVLEHQQFNMLKKDQLLRHQPITQRPVVSSEKRAEGLKSLSMSISREKELEIENARIEEELERLVRPDAFEETFDKYHEEPIFRRKKLRSR